MGLWIKMNAIETIISIIIIIIIGYLTKRVGLLNSNDSITLNKIVINVALPSLIFITIYTADLSNLNSLISVTFICILIGFVGGFIGYIFSKIMNYPQKTRWGITTASAMFNSGFMGYPIVLGVFGGLGLIKAIFFDMGSTIMFISFGMIFTLLFGGTYSTVAKRTLLFPPVWAIILGVTLNVSHFSIGSLLPQIFNYLSGAVVPLIMISLGLSLDASSLKNCFKEASAVSSIKLILAPLIALIIVTLLDIKGLNSNVILTESAMPSAMLALVLAINYKLDVKVVGASIFLTTVLSMITLPILLSLI